MATKTPTASSKGAAALNGKASGRTNERGRASTGKDGKDGKDGKSGKPAKLPNKLYEAELQRLQAELVAMQELLIRCHWYQK